MPAQVFDTDLGNKSLTPSVDLAAESANAQPVANTPVVMLDADGNKYTVPHASINIATQKGWRIETPAEAAASAEHEAKVAAAQALLEKHPWNTAANQFLNEASLGVKPLLEQRGKTDEENRVATEAEERYTENNPIKSYAAKAAGFVAPLAIPGIGEIGEAVEGGIKGAGEIAGTAGAALAKEAAVNSVGEEIGRGVVQAGADVSLGRRVAASAANYATQGAIYSSPAAATQLFIGDPEGAAETMAWGTGLSGLLGAGSGLVGAGAKAAIKGAGELVDTLGSKLAEKDATGLSHLDNISRDILGISDAEAKKLSDNGKFPDRLENLVKTADSEGILRAAPGEERNKLINEVHEDSGKELGKIYDSLEKLQAAHDLPTPSISGGKLYQDFDAEIEKGFPELKDANLHSDKIKLVNKIKSVFEGLEEYETSFKDVWKLGQSISKMSSDFNADSTSAKIVRVAYGVVKRNLEADAETIFTKAHGDEGQELMYDFLTQKARFSAASTLKDNINVFKGTGKLSSPLSTALGVGNLGTIGVALAGMAAGHPGIAALGVAGKLAFDAFRKNDAGLLGKSVSYLRGIDPGQIGGHMAKAGQDALQAHIENIPHYLSGSKVAARSVAAANPYKYLLGDATGLTTEQQYKKLTTAITTASIDINRTANIVGSHASMFSTTSVQLASLVAHKKLAALAYLQSQIPKNPNPPKPFQKDDWKPSAAQQKEFLNKVAIVNDPNIVWAHYQDGTIGKLDREVLQAVYPKIYGEMVSKIVNIAYDPRTPKVSYAERLSLSMFTGIPLDQSLKNINAIQQALAVPSVPTAAGKKSPSARTSKPTFPHMKEPEMMQTGVGRRTYQ